MKKITTVLLSLFIMQFTTAQVSDSAVNVFGSYICNCIDTLNLNKPEAQLKKDFNLCKTLSLANLLNRQLINPEVMTDDKQSADLQNKAFRLLEKNCDGIKRLITH
jgi:hypothetical protein